MAVRLFVRGNLGQNFDLKPIQTANDQSPAMVLNFSVAAPFFKRNSEGKNEIIHTEWIECEYWNRRATHLYKVLKKGMPVLLVGDERHESYTNSSGQEVHVRKLRVEEIYIEPSERIESITLRPPRSPSQEGAMVADDSVNMPYNP